MRIRGRDFRDRRPSESAESILPRLLNPRFAITRLFLLLLFFWSLFLCSRSGRSGFALFFFLGDDFRSGSRRFRFGHGRLFFDDWREYGERSEIGRHLWRYPRRELDVANVNGITNV